MHQLMRYQNLLLVLFSLASGCPSAPQADAGSPPPADAANVADSGTSPGDAGAVPDASVPPPPPTDAGSPPSPVTDAGTPAPTPVDAGPPPMSGAYGALGPFAVATPVTATAGELELTLYQPESSGPFPVVIFNHGFQLGPEDYGSYGQHLASHGIVAILPTYPGGFPGPNHRELADLMKGLIDWVEAEAQGAGSLAGVVDAARLGVAGHSLGGKIALLVATEDTRPEAVFGIDPVDTAGGPLTSPGPDFPSVTPELMEGLQIPAVFLGETTNATCSGFVCQPCAPEEENFQRYYEAPGLTAPALEIEVLGANHMDFLDDPNCGFTCNVCADGTAPSTQTLALTRRTLVAFFAYTLRDDDDARAYLTGSGIESDVQAGRLAIRSKNNF